MTKFASNTAAGLAALFIAVALWAPVIAVPGSASAAYAAPLLA